MAFTPGTPTAPTTYAGYRGPNDAVSSARVKVDIRNEVYLVQPDAAPAMFLVGKINKSEKATQWQFSTMLKRPYPRDFIITEAYAGGNAAGASTTLTVSTADAAKIVANNLIMSVLTNQIFYVSSVNTGTGDLTVRANIGGTGNDAAEADNQPFVILNSAYADGARAGSPRSVIEQFTTNYCQIFRTPYGWTGRDEQTDMIGGKDPAIERKWAAVEHNKSRENALMFGKPQLLTDSDGHLLTMTGGWNHFMNVHRWDLNATWPSEGEFNEAIGYAFRDGKNGNRNGNGSKLFFCSHLFASQFARWGREKLEHRVLDAKYGLWCTEYITPYGVLKIVPTPTLDDDVHGAFAFLVDSAHVFRKYYQGRDTMILKDRQETDRDGYLEEILTDEGFGVEVPEAHMVIYDAPVDPTDPEA